MDRSSCTNPCFTCQSRRRRCVGIRPLRAGTVVALGKRMPMLRWGFMISTGALVAIACASTENLPNKGGGYGGAETGGASGASGSMGKGGSSGFSGGGASGGFGGTGGYGGTATGGSGGSSAAG